MAGFETILTSILTLGLAMAIGFVAVKTGYISEDVKNAISKVIIKITMPILVITALTKVTLDRAKIVNSLLVVAIAIGSIAVLYGIGILISRMFRMDRPRAIVQQCLTAFGNVVFLGYPLIRAIYGEEGMLYAALYGFANDLFVWTLAVYQLATIAGKGKTPRENLKNLINPATIAFVISFIMMVFGLKFTGILGTVLDGIGGMTTYLSMLFIGGTLALVDFRKIYKRVSLFLLVAVKMLIVPVLLVLLLRLFPLDSMVKGIIILQVAMPSQTILTILTTEYKGDVIWAAEGVFITTIASLATLPAIYYFMTMFG